MFSKPESARRFRARARPAYAGSPVVLEPAFLLSANSVIVNVETSAVRTTRGFVRYKRWGRSRLRRIQELEPKRHSKHLRAVGQ